MGVQEELRSPLDKYFIIFFYFCLFYAFFKYSFHYFTLKNIPVINPTIPFGNIRKVLRPKKPRYEYFRELYSKIKLRGYKHGGIYLFFKPFYMPTDLNYIRNVLNESFDNFSERGLYTSGNELSDNLLNLTGGEWKEVRVALTPVFSAKNISKFLVNVEKVTENLKEFLEHKQSNVSLQRISNCFSLNLIANLFFGVDLNTFLENGTPFEKHTTKLFKNSLYNSKLIIWSMMFPGLSKKLKLKIFHKKTLKYFEKTIHDVIDFREVNQIKKNDFLQNLIDYNIDGKINLRTIISTCILSAMFIQETVSNALSFALYEISKNPEIQMKIREEVSNAEISYDNLGRMVYLNQVIQETLRLYPIVPTITRRCIKEYKIPESKDSLDKGTGLIISILGIHKDPDIYENPEIFDPSRFNEENTTSRHPYAYMPFGEGPRICPAIKFVHMILKLGIISVLKNFKIDPSNNAKSVILSKKTVLMQSKNDLCINLGKL